MRKITFAIVLVRQEAFSLFLEETVKEIIVSG